MAVSICDVHTDSSGKDKSSYGTAAFPVSCFSDDLTKMNVNLHWHEEFEFIFVTEGNVYVQAGNERFLMEKGSSILINMNTVHSVEKGTEAKSELKSLVFSSSLIADYPESVFWKKYIQPLQNKKNSEYDLMDGKEIWQQKILSLMRESWNLIVEESEEYENRARFNITSAFHQLVSNIELQPGKTRLSQNQILKNLQIKRLLEFLNKNYQRKISLSDLCTFAEISESSCLRLFREFTRTTPVQYLKKIRLEKADELLNISSLSVTETALSCGFNDISYFIKSYKEAFGRTPKGKSVSA